MDTLDYKQLAEVVNPDTTRVAYETNKHLFTKVAFDVFQLNNSPFESYWILEQGDDGKEYLVAKYEESVDEANLEARSNWQALSDKEAKNVTVFYKGVPIRRCASAEFNFDASDVHIFTNAMIDALANDLEMVQKMLDTLPEEKQNALREQFPELPVK